MTKDHCLAVCAVLLLTAGQAMGAPISIIRITDGDTVVAMVGGRKTSIRLYGIDTPEIRQSYGKVATLHLRRIVSGKTVEMERMDKDRYGRTVARLRTGDGTDINEAMVAAGMAWVYPKYCTAAVCRQWKDREGEARAARLGLWSERDPMPPWLHRHR